MTAAMSAPTQASRFLSALDNHPARWAFAIILASFAARLFFVASGALNLAQDEAQYWDWSRHLQLSYYSKGPLIAWVIGFWTQLFGATEFGVRIGAVIHSTLAQTLLYIGAARLMGRPRLGVLALIVANTMPLFLASGVLMTTDNILMLCWMGAVFCLYELTRRHSLPALLALAACMALGNLAKYMMLAFFAVAICHLFLLHRHRLLPPRSARNIIIAMTLGNLVGYLPIFIWNMAHNWVGFLHVGTLAGVTGKVTHIIRFDTPLEFLAGQFGVASPWWMALILIGGLAAALVAIRGKANTLPGGGLSDALSGPDSQTDHIRQTVSDDRVRQAALMASAFWPIWLAMLFWSFHTRMYVNWPGMCYVGGILLAASALEGLFLAPKASKSRKFAPLWPSLGAALTLIMCCITWLPLPPKLDPTLRLKGWSDLGHKLETLQQEFPHPDKVFYFAHNYDTTAELAFYGPGQPQAYSADFGRRRSQYDFWPGPTDAASPGGDKTGWDAIYVDPKVPALKELEEMFDKVSVMSYTSTHNGRPARTFTIALLYNFNGHWPHSSHARY